MSDAATLRAEHFDGVSARARPVRLQVEGRHLRIAGESGSTRVPLSQVQWPERQRDGTRVAHLADGGSLHCADGAAWDAWAAASGQGESWVVKAQQSWRLTLAAGATLLLLCAALYTWGLPLAARGALSCVPPAVDAQLGQVALDTLRADGLLGLSQVPQARRQRLRELLATALQRGHGVGAPAVQLHFHQSRLGPNAFALPGGHVVHTDELIALLDDDEPRLLGVLAHEAGHLQHRHGMRALPQASLLGSLGSLAFGDFSGMLAAAPALLGHLAYSRDFEREADTEAIAVLKANGLDPAAMAAVFERLQARRGAGGDGGRLGIALASHPADAERIVRFRAAGAATPR